MGLGAYGETHLRAGMPIPLLGLGRKGLGVSDSVCFMPAGTPSPNGIKPKPVRNEYQRKRMPDGRESSTGHTYTGENKA